MYKVYCDGHLLYSPALEDYRIFNAKIDLELNKTGSFTFTIYPNHPNFEKLRKMRSIITVYKDVTGSPLFRGRILNEEQGFYNEKQITCEGELAFLVDSVQRPYELENQTISQVLSFFIDRHNQQSNTTHQFTIGTVGVTGSVSVSDSEYTNTWDAINRILIEPHGGFLRTRHTENITYIDYVAELDTLCNQQIKFGKNLLDLKKTVKGENIGTVIIPLGAVTDTNERLTIKSVTDNHVDYVYDQTAVNTYGVIYKTVVYDDITDPSELLAKGNEYLVESITLPMEINLSAVDLAALNSDINAFEIGTNVRIISDPHGIDTTRLVTHITFDLFDPSQNQLTLGKVYSKTLTEQSASSIGALNNKIDRMNESIGQKISNTCYSKADSDNRYARRYVKTQNDGTGIITAAAGQLGGEIFNVSILDAAQSYFTGQLFYSAGISELSKYSGDLTASANTSGDIAINGTSPYTFTFST